MFSMALTFGRLLLQCVTSGTQHAEYFTQKKLNVNIIASTLLRNTLNSGH